MNLVWGLLMVVGACAITVTAMLLVRRRAPVGSYFSDGDRASGVFGVLATGFSVLLGFVIFLGFESYDDSRAGAEAEATVLLQQVETAQFFQPRTATELTGELVCYGRSVVGAEWRALDDHTVNDSVNPWAAEMFRTLKSLDPTSAAEQSAYDRWMDQTAAREQARMSRLHGAEGIIPLPLWLVLGGIAALILSYMLFFADRGEHATTQGMLMGSVTIVITSTLLLLAFFDQPYGGGVGTLRPTAMQRTVRITAAELTAAGMELTPPCDRDGVAG